MRLSTVNQFPTIWWKLQSTTRDAHMFTVLSFLDVLMVSGFEKRVSFSGCDDGCLAV
jgi:hypothetical protein